MSESVGHSNLGAKSERLDVRKMRFQRLALWQVASGSLESGLVSVGLAAWLLGVSSRYVRRVCGSRLACRSFAGQRLVLIASVVQYASSTGRTSKLKSKATN